jgi:hypothetical protein
VVNKLFAGQKAFRIFLSFWHLVLKTNFARLQYNSAYRENQAPSIFRLIFHRRFYSIAIR